MPSEPCAFSAVLPENVTLADWLQYLESRHPRGEAGIELGLERVRRVANALRQQPFCPILTIAGTNGKGSTAACLESILCRAGYRVGCYASPHLLRYNERVRIMGEGASDAALIAAFQRVETARRAAGDVFLTYFEFGTLAAWETFVSAGCEVLVLEVGLGGRLDAVNLHDADVAVVTTVDLDHREWLGADREAIALEKAGIFRAQRPALCGDIQPPRSLVAHARELGAPLWHMGRDFGFQKDDSRDTPRLQWKYWFQREGHRPIRRTLAYPGLRGGVQLKNATLALAALDLLAPRLPVTAQAIREGLLETRLPGRFQILPGRPAIVLDVAHNPQAAQALAENLSGMGFYPNTHAVCGMLADKDAQACVAALSGNVTRWFLATLEGVRGRTAETLARAVAAADPGVSCQCHSSPEEAFAAAREVAGENDRILVFGSFSTVAAVLGALG
ncbi:MAG: bifunctional tetrahydrofolate synthase/dihydrofolate synthase, partial [Zoogloeaceae bacterium]|nr:bifunctional tetrahydrofolate synthase/dihydrofolate synthase [Zoogloeaceae bacterium]